MSITTVTFESEGSMFGIIKLLSNPSMKYARTFFAKELIVQQKDFRIRIPNNFDAINSIYLDFPQELPDPSFKIVIENRSPNQSFTEERALTYEVLPDFVYKISDNFLNDDKILTMTSRNVFLEISVGELKFKSVAMVLRYTGYSYGNEDRALSIRSPNFTTLPNEEF